MENKKTKTEYAIGKKPYLSPIAEFFRYEKEDVDYDAIMTSKSTTENEYPDPWDDNNWG